MSTHELKVWPEYFDALASGEKSFEFRKDDREPRFAVGDVLRLREYHPGCQSSHCRLNGCGFPQGCPRDREGFTERELSRLVTYVARGGVIPPGYCVMSVVPVSSSGTTEPTTTGVSLIAAERKRQVDTEGWTPEHDAQHGRGEMAITAACYAAFSTDAQVLVDGKDAFPWGSCDDKRLRHSRQRQLVIAGALIAAEIDRLAASRSSTEQDQK